MAGKGRESARNRVQKLRGKIKGIEKGARSGRRPHTHTHTYRELGSFPAPRTADHENNPNNNNNNNNLGWQSSEEGATVERTAKAEQCISLHKLCERGKKRISEAAKAGRPVSQSVCVCSGNGYGVGMMVVVLWV